MGARRLRVHQQHHAWKRLPGPLEAHVYINAVEVKTLRNAGFWMVLVSMFWGLFCFRLLGLVWVFGVLRVFRRFGTLCLSQTHRVWSDLDLRFEQISSILIDDIKLSVVFSNADTV